MEIDLPAVDFSLNIAASFVLRIVVRIRRFVQIEIELPSRYGNEDHRELFEDAGRHPTTPLLTGSAVLAVRQVPSDQWHR